MPALAQLDADWYLHFDPGCLQRGRGYARSGRVIDHQIDTENEQIWAAVAGSRGMAYETVVDLGDLRSECSCPVGYQCKHAVAAIETMLREGVLELAEEFTGNAGSDATSAGDDDDHPAARLPPVSVATVGDDQRRLAEQRAAWLARLDRQSRERNDAADGRLSVGTHLVYLLVRREGRFRLLAATARLGKRGWGQVRIRDDLWQILQSSQRPKYLTERDRPIIALLHELGFRRGPSVHSLAGATGGEALLQAVATGRCFLDEVGGPRLRRGGRVAVDWAWGPPEPAGEDAAGPVGRRLGLTAAASPGAGGADGADGADGASAAARRCELLATAPPLVLDRHRALVLQPDLVLAAEDLAAVAEMPPLSPAHRRRLGPRLAALVGTLPPDPDPDPAPDEVVTPRARLYLWRAPGRVFTSFGLRGSGRAGATAVWGLARFAYGEHELAAVPMDGPVTLADGSVVERDGDAERALVRALDEQALVRCDGRAGELFGQPQHLAPEQLEACRVLWNRGSQAAAGELPEPTVLALRAAGWELEGPLVSAAERGASEELRGETVRASLQRSGERLDLRLELVLDRRVGVDDDDQDPGLASVDLLPILRRCFDEGLGALERLPTERAASGELLRRLPLPDGRVIVAPDALVRGLYERVLDLFAGRGEPGAIEWGRAASLVELEDLPGFVGWGGDPTVTDRLQALCTRLSAPAPVTLPRGLRAELRDYQRAGVAWLAALHDSGFGGLLADDMGLGKTVQVLAHLLRLHEAGELSAPALVVAPVSVLGGWVREAERFAPSLRVGVLHGQEREAVRAELARYDLVVSSYATVLRDRDELCATTFSVLICDEAQAIKNPTTATWRAIRDLAAHQRISLTGTPVENSLDELWSHLHLLVPGLLGGAERFARSFRDPIQEQGDERRAAALRRRIAPFLLRRTKEAVARDLPPKTEIEIPVELAPIQRQRYEAVRIAMDDEVQRAIAEQGVARSKLVFLEALLRLRQVCCDPRLGAGGDPALPASESAKLAALSDLLPSLVADGRRILLFSQFTRMLELIAHHCDALGIPYLVLTGRTRHRQQRIDAFQRGEAPLFLISLKAGGSGLTLTAADTVIHYDPWWNPAVEAQATDRAHRIGQDKPVFVYRLRTVGTVEDRIQALQERKRAAADALFDEQGQRSGELDAALMQDLLRPVD